MFCELTKQFLPSFKTNTHYLNKKFVTVILQILVIIFSSVFDLWLIYYDIY